MAPAHGHERSRPPRRMTASAPSAEAPSTPSEVAQFYSDGFRVAGVRRIVTLCDGRVLSTRCVQMGLRLRDTHERCSPCSPVFSVVGPMIGGLHPVGLLSSKPVSSRLMLAPEQRQAGNHRRVRRGTTDALSACGTVFGLDQVRRRRNPRRRRRRPSDIYARSEVRALRRRIFLRRYASPSRSGALQLPGRRA
jgi:hypothetical protein